jgi:cysteine desulfurase
VRIYLDHNATTPLRSEVVQEMLRVLENEHGNPSSTHAEGAAARATTERARSQVARSLNVAPGEVWFTAGATEANNSVLRGLLGDPSSEPAAPRHVVTTQTEHPSVRAPLEAFETRGHRVTWLRVDAHGRLDPAAVIDALEPDTALVSILWANNETGVIQPMREIGERVKERGIKFHVDATQALGKAPVDLSAVQADFASLSAHKLNGPKGVGCLVVRQPDGLPALLMGGGQEWGHRGGTENVASIAGFGVACELAQRELDSRMQTYAALRDRLWEGMRAKIARVRRNGTPAETLVNTLNVEFEDTPGEVLLQALDLEGVAVSAGAACHSGSVSPSHVLVAMGRSPEQARGSLRLSVGHGVDEGQIDHVIELLSDLVPRVREAGPL